MEDTYIAALRRGAYELYKMDWVSRLPQETLMESCREYVRSIVSSIQSGEPIHDSNYADYLFENGYNGSIYVCFDEFIDAEYRDLEYMTELLQDDALVDVYKHFDPLFGINGLSV